MKKTISFLLVISIITAYTQNASALTDAKAFTDPVSNTYEGRSDGATIIRNVSFTDVPANHWAKEAITRSGALNMISGYDRAFRPGSSITNEEAVAIMIRAIGQEQEALRLANNLARTLPEDSSTRQIWSIGFLQLGRNMGLITAAEMADATAQDQTVLDPQNNFVRASGAQRERVAEWIVRALSSIVPEAFNLSEPIQKIYEYSDWDQIDINRLNYVEAITKNGVMSGANGRFNPKSPMTRADMAQALKNMDSIYFDTIGFAKKTGTVAGIKDEQTSTTAMAGLFRKLYIRDNEGKIDVIQYEIESNTSPQAVNKDVVVYNNGQIGGLASLQEGDQIEYIVAEAAQAQGAVVEKTAMYIQKTGGLNTTSAALVQGYLMGIDFDKGTITIKDAAEKTFEYPIVQGLAGTDGNDRFVTISLRKIKETELPIGSIVTLSLKNNITDVITLLGEPQVAREIAGVVVENNPEMSFITIIDANGAEVTKQYYNKTISVEKQQYFDTDDEIGYIDKVFPNFQYNPRTTSISEVEPGDIVFLRLDDKDANIVVMASASTNYVMKYGKVLQFRSAGANGGEMLVEYEDKTSSWQTITPNIFISADGYPKTMSDINPGDWVKTLVNQAVIGPGYMIESVKEVIVEGAEHFITNILRGQLGGIDPVQKELMLQNAETLAKTGWSGHQQIKKLNISNANIEYYYNGQRIALDYALQYLKRSNGEVYVAMENHFAGERVAKVTFRDQRDEILNPDNVIQSDGNGNFRIMQNAGSITTDAGTIVRRYGRLTSGQNIMVPDYARVVLNGENAAAVVDIQEAPDYSGVTIARGRILTIDDGKSFIVKSMALLTGNSWQVTPIERQFTIDYSTRYYDESGWTDGSEFISYTDDSKYDRVYTVVVDGAKATAVIENPYANRAVRGTIYEATDGSIGLKDGFIYNNDNGKWTSVGIRNDALSIALPANGIIVKNNQVITASNLEQGDQVIVMTTALPDNVSQATTIPGYIVLVEK